MKLKDYEKAHELFLTSFLLVLIINETKRSTDLAACMLWLLKALTTSAIHGCCKLTYFHELTLSIFLCV